jgi:hypothetical protein
MIQSAFYHIRCCVSGIKCAFWYADFVTALDEVKAHDFPVTESGTNEKAPIDLVHTVVIKAPPFVGLTLRFCLVIVCAEDSCTPVPTDASSISVNDI